MSRRISLLLTLTLLRSNAFGMVAGPLPPPPAVQRTEISKLARTQGLHCLTKPDGFLMDISAVRQPYSARRIKSDEAAWKAHTESVIAEGWHDKYTLLKVERMNTYHRYQYQQVSDNGSGTEKYYVVHTFHLKNGRVIKTVDARCTLN